MANPEPTPSATDSPFTSETTTFPTFLSTDPYPSTTPSGRPLSSGSGTTDAASEFGTDDYRSAKERQSAIPSVTGPPGEPGLPPSRPSSAGTATGSAKRSSVRMSQIAPPSSRRGLQAFMSNQSRSSFRNSTTTDGERSRPSTAIASPTHVPSLAAQGFSNPLSGSKLQVQRDSRPTGNTLQSPPMKDEITEEPETSKRRYSGASLHTLREAQMAAKPEDVPPLPNMKGDSAVDASRSQASGANTTPGNRDTASQKELPTIPQSPKSRLSIRASLGLVGRSTSWASRDRRQDTHQQLHSEPSSPVNYTEKTGLPAESKVVSTGKNYEYYAGNVLFLGSGRFMNTRARPLNVVTFILTLLPAILFFAFSAPWLWNNVSPAIPIIFAYVTYITISSFSHAAFSDPGILPRNLHPHPPNPEEQRDPLTVGPATTEWVMVKTFPSARASVPDSEAGTVGTTTAMEVPTKYCKSCNVWRPPRAHHCRTCDGCVETHDHHCVWLNNCIGRRNYRYFFNFVGFASLMAVLLLIFSIVHIQYYGQQNGESFAGALSGRSQERVAFAMFLYALIALPYPCSLWSYHVFLMARGETTREYLNSHKFLKKDRHRPFTQGKGWRNWWKNWAVVLVRPVPPTYMSFTKAYQVGDLRFGYTERQSVRKSENRRKYSVEMKQLGGEKKEQKNGGQVQPESANNGAVNNSST